LTHLHGDHAAGIPFLVLEGVYASRRVESLDIVGPAGTRQRVEQLLESTYEHAVWQPRPFELRVDELAPGGVVNVHGFEIRAFAADHMDPPHVPLSLRVKTPSGRVAAFSGDTRWPGELAACARGADVLVAECTGLAPPLGRHCTWEDWRQGHAELDARRIYLSHLDAGVRAAAPRLLAELPAGAPVAFADDGLVVDF
jgi:ribonuclease BN (tRNA processing enzyme)